MCRTCRRRVCVLPPEARAAAAAAAANEDEAKKRAEADKAAREADEENRKARQAERERRRKRRSAPLPASGAASTTLFERQAEVTYTFKAEVKGGAAEARVARLAALAGALGDGGGGGGGDGDALALAVALLGLKEKDLAAAAKKKKEEEEKKKKEEAEKKKKPKKCDTCKEQCPTCRVCCACTAARSSRRRRRRSHGCAPRLEGRCQLPAKQSRRCRGDSKRAKAGAAALAKLQKAADDALAAAIKADEALRKGIAAKKEGGDGKKEKDGEEEKKKKKKPQESAGEQLARLYEDRRVALENVQAADQLLVLSASRCTCVECTFGVAPVCDARFAGDCLHCAQSVRLVGGRRRALVDLVASDTHCQVVSSVAASGQACGAFHY